MVKRMEIFFKVSPDDYLSWGLRSPQPTRGPEIERWNHLKWTRPAWLHRTHRDPSQDRPRLLICREWKTLTALAGPLVACLSLYVKLSPSFVPFCHFPPLFHPAFFTFLLWLLFPVYHPTSQHSPFSFCCWIRDILLPQRHALFYPVKITKPRIWAALRCAR